MKIKFDVVKFSRWLDTLGCDCCDHNLILDGDVIISRSESNIYGEITKSTNIELEGEFC